MNGHVFVVHHNPNNKRYRYRADPEDPVASAKALLAAGDSTWVAGNCRRMIRPGDLLFFKFGGARLRQEGGIYAAGQVTRAPVEDRQGVWVFRYKPDRPLTRCLAGRPIVGRDLHRVCERSFGSSIQVVKKGGRARLATLLGARLLSGSADAGSRVTHGLLILKDPLDKILAGTKTWEIRGKATTRRGRIALIESKSGCVVGTCDIVDVRGPLSLAELRRRASVAGFRAHTLPYPSTYAWVLRDARRLAAPIPYRHPPGAVIWVRLPPGVTRPLEEAAAHA